MPIQVHTCGVCCLPSAVYIMLTVPQDVAVLSCGVTRWIQFAMCVQLSVSIVFVRQLRPGLTVIAHRGGFDSYGSGGGGRSDGDQQSFGAPRTGGGGFDNYNDRAGSSGGRGRGRGRADSGDFQQAGSYGNFGGASEAPATECEDLSLCCSAALCCWTFHVCCLHAVCNMTV